MAVYLVDFENVSSAGLSGIQKLTKEDKVYIFYTVNASNMSFAAHMNLLSSPAEITYYNVASGGKNALDFQLASFLGYLICQGKEKKFCIISNDRGFEYVKTFWERNGIAVDISISGAPSINRSLTALEKPFAARIQQQNVPNTPPDASVEEKPAALTEEVIQPEEKQEKQAQQPDIPKKRGRPRSSTASGSSRTSKPKNTVNAVTEKVKEAKEKLLPEAASEQEKSISAEPADNPEKVIDTVQEPVSSAEPEKTEKTSRRKIPPEARQTLEHALAKAGVTTSGEISGVSELLENAGGKQQFYRGILKIFGMERGVEVYKAVRPEYTNLTKLIK